VPDLIRFCKKHNLIMITVDELARYRVETDYEESLGAIFELFPTAVKSFNPELDALSRNPIATTMNAEYAG